MTDEIRILCFGDSATWGWVPTEAAAPTVRYPRGQRWTGVLADALGEGYEIIEEGLSGRTTDIDDSTDPRLNGASYLPAALASHLPLDLVIVLLGTNDTKASYARSVHDIAQGMGHLLTQILGSAGGVGAMYPAPRAMVVAPPQADAIPDPWFADVFSGAPEKLRELPAAYRKVASFYRAGFFDSGSVISSVGVDGLHLTVENNRALGESLAERIAALPLR